jgi:hypothetical protein
MERANFLQYTVKELSSIDKGPHSLWEPHSGYYSTFHNRLVYRMIPCHGELLSRVTENNDYVTIESRLQKRFTFLPCRHLRHTPTFGGMTLISLKPLFLLGFWMSCKYYITT